MRGSGCRAVRIGTGSLGWELCPDGALGLGLMKGGLALCTLGLRERGACGLTVVSVPGPAEVPEPPTAQPERGLIVLPQGGAVPQGEGGVLGTPVGDEAVLLASAGTGQGLCHGPAWMRGRKPMTQHPCRRTPHTSPTPAQWAQGVPTQASRRGGCCSSHSHFPHDSRLLVFAMPAPHPITSSAANWASPSLISLVHISPFMGDICDIHQGSGSLKSVLPHPQLFGSMSQKKNPD